jgi:hypothetical protein
MFAEENLRVRGYTILGTPAHKRVTLAQGPRMVGEMMNANANRPTDYLPIRHFGKLVRVLGAAGADASALTAETGRLFDSLCSRSELFVITADTWLSTLRRHWKFVFDPSDWVGDPLRAWRVDRLARTVYFNPRPLYYLARNGPQVLTPERRLAGFFSEHVFGHGGLPPFDLTLNRGPHILRENLMFEELGKIGQRVSAELTDRPDLLWDKVVFASKAASDEDLRLAPLLKAFSLGNRRV